MNLLPGDIRKRRINMKGIIKVFREWPEELYGKQIQQWYYEIQIPTLKVRVSPMVGECFRTSKFCEKQAQIIADKLSIAIQPKGAK